MRYTRERRASDLIFAEHALSLEKGERPVDGIQAFEPAVEITISPSRSEDLPSTAAEARHQVGSTHISANSAIMRR
jgi:hypothetical protein